MNFLLRSTHHVAAEQPSLPEAPVETQQTSKPAITLEGLIAEDPYPQFSTIDERDEESDGVVAENGGTASSGAKHESSVAAKHSDVSEEEGWITIPYKKLPDNWNDAADINSLRSLDRPFVFPGEQIHILACLSACNRDTEIITPFKVAAVMSKNGIGKNQEKRNGNVEDQSNSHSREGEMSLGGQSVDQNGENLLKDNQQKDVPTGESLLRMEDHKRQTEILLHRFEKSHFFVRIAESGEPLWSKKSAKKMSTEPSMMNGKKSNEDETMETAKHTSHINAVIDKGNFDPKLSGGAARNTVKCCSLSSGDIVVLLQVNVGVDFLNDPVIEVLQFEKYHETNFTSENLNDVACANQDPCGELLKWLLPLDNTIPSPAHPLSTPVNSNSGYGNTTHKSSFSASSGSQLFSFGHFRSYSMSAIPQNTTLPAAPVKAASSKPSFNLEDWDQYESQKIWKTQISGPEGLLSFRGVSLERERFSVCCGLEGIYIPGKRWRRKLEIIQPVEIHSFAADCNTDDLLCVQIRNICPAHAPDIVIYIDAITIIFEEASKGGQSLLLPIACIEAGNDHSLPNLALRRGEEHSFILKPAQSMWNNVKVNNEKKNQPMQLQSGNGASSLRLPSKTVEGKRSASAERYAVMVSCRCNYTESRLFFKQPTSWQPRISRDLMISVASEISGQLVPNKETAQLPVQVLTLQASNLTSQDLTLTVLAPASFTSPPSVVSLNSAPTSPMSPFVGFPEFTGRFNSDKRGAAIQRLASAPAPLASEKRKQNDNGLSRTAFDEQVSPLSDVLPSSGLGCTHLWLHSRVPLGCVPSQSTATIKLELLPLTDGIITLDTLQIDVKEKGLTYIPEHSLMINATSSISTGII